MVTITNFKRKDLTLGWMLIESRRFPSSTPSRCRTQLRATLIDDILNIVDNSFDYMLISILSWDPVAKQFAKIYHSVVVDLNSYLNCKSSSIKQTTLLHKNNRDYYGKYWFFALVQTSVSTLPEERDRKGTESSPSPHCRLQRTALAKVGLGGCLPQQGCQLLLHYRQANK